MNAKTLDIAWKYLLNLPGSNRADFRPKSRVKLYHREPHYSTVFDRFKNAENRSGTGLRWEYTAH